MKMTGDEARSIVRGDNLKWKEIETKTVGQSRWSVEYESIFKNLNDGKFYCFDYSRGATEMQDEQPYEYDDEVEVYEVAQVEKVVKVWEAV